MIFLTLKTRSIIESPEKRKFALFVLAAAISLFFLSIWRQTKQPAEKAQRTPFSFRILEDFDDGQIRRMRILLPVETYSGEKLRPLFEQLIEHHLPKNELLFEVFVYVDAVPNNPPFKDSIYATTQWSEEGKYAMAAWFEWNLGVGTKAPLTKFYVYAPDYRKTSLDDLKSEVF